MSLYRTYRPKNMDEVVGQAQAKATLQAKLDSDTMPNVVLLSGSSGTGKTTLARIVAEELGCTGTNLVERNCADVRGIDSVRDIDDVVRLAPMGGKCRVWILDEVHQLPKTTQSAFLKVLEDTPPRAYFLLCTTDLAGLLPTFLSRAWHVTLRPLTERELEDVIATVLSGEQRTISRPVLRAVSTAANGSARVALQLLESALTAADEDGMLEAVGAATVSQAERAEFLALALIKQSGWAAIVTSVAKVEDGEVETLRRQVLEYARKVLLGNSQQRGMAYMVITAFADSFSTSGRAGLAAACWQCCQRKGV